MCESMSDRRRYAGAGLEPCLAEVLADPLVHAVMRRDSLTAEQVCAELTWARRRLLSGEADRAIPAKDGQRAEPS